MSDEVGDEEVLMSGEGWVYTRWEGPPGTYSLTPTRFIWFKAPQLFPERFPSPDAVSFKLADVATLAIHPEPNSLLQVHATLTDNVVYKIVTSAPFSRIGPELAINQAHRTEELERGLAAGGATRLGFIYPE